MFKTICIFLITSLISTSSFAMKMSPAVEDLLRQVFELGCEEGQDSVKQKINEPLCQNLTDKFIDDFKKRLEKK